MRAMSEFANQCNIGGRGAQRQILGRLKCFGLGTYGKSVFGKSGHNNKFSPSVLVVHLVGDS